MRSVHLVLPFVSSILVAACGGSTPPPSAPAAPAPAAPEAPAAPSPEAAHHGHHEHGHGEHGHGAEPKAGANLKKPGEAGVGDTSSCPVSGEEFDIDESSPKVEHAGKTYYFCCKGCAKKFQADPQKFLQEQPKPST